MEVLVLESFPFSIRCFWESGCGGLLLKMSHFGKGLLLGSIGRRRGISVQGKLGMAMGLGCGRPLGVGGKSLVEEPLSMWEIVKG